MSGNVNNGARVPAEFGDWRGTAGVQGDKAAIFADARAVKPGTTGMLDGVPVRVLAVEKSAFVKGMIVLTVEPAT